MKTENRHTNLSSEGNLKEKLYLNRAGTPGGDDYIVSFDVVLNLEWDRKEKVYLQPTMPVTSYPDFPGTDEEVQGRSLHREI